MAARLRSLDSEKPRPLAHMRVARTRIPDAGMRSRVRAEDRARDPGREPSKTQAELDETKGEAF